MTDTATQEAPAATRKPLSPERLAKMKAGRERAAAAKRAATPVEASDADRRIAELEKALAEMRTLLAAKPASVPLPGTVPATINIEAWYEFKPRGGWKVVGEKGLPRIDSAEDARWDGELMDPPYNGTVAGCLRVAKATRVDGRALEIADIHGGPCHMNVARDFLRKFKERQDAGEQRPWDVEHWNREKLAAAEKAKAEGRLEDLRTMAEMFKTVMQGGPASVTAAEAAK